MSEHVGDSNALKSCQLPEQRAELGFAAASSDLQQLAFVLAGPTLPDLKRVFYTMTHLV